jgi:hypothetical protein
MNTSIFRLLLAKVSIHYTDSYEHHIYRHDNMRNHRNTIKILERHEQHGHDLAHKRQSQCIITPFCA